MNQDASRGKIIYLSDNLNEKNSKSHPKQSYIYVEVRDLDRALKDPLEYISKRIHLNYPLHPQTGDEIVIAGRERAVLDIGKKVSIGNSVVFRMDETDKGVVFQIGDDSKIGHGVVFHASGNKIGDNVTINPYAVIHGCNIGDNSEIGIGSVIDGVTLEPGTVVGPFSYIGKPQQSKIIPRGTISVGNLELKLPEKAIKELHNKRYSTYLQGREAAAKHHTADPDQGLFDPLAYIDNRPQGKTTISAQNRNSGILI